MELKHLPITLLHYGYLFNDLLKVRLNRNLLDCNNLASFFMDSFEHAAIGPITRHANLKDNKVKMITLMVCVLKTQKCMNKFYITRLT